MDGVEWCRGGEETTATSFRAPLECAAGSGSLLSALYRQFDWLDYSTEVVVRPGEYTMAAMSLVRTKPLVKI